MRSSDSSAEWLSLELPESASFPNPARGYWTSSVSLDRSLIKRPASTFILRINGNPLLSLGLLDGDELVVDRAIRPAVGRVCVVEHDGEHRVGIFKVERGTATLVSDVERIPLTNEVIPWGVATVGIRHLPGL